MRKMGVSVDELFARAGCVSCSKAHRFFDGGGRFYSIPYVCARGDESSSGKCLDRQMMWSELKAGLRRLNTSVRRKVAATPLFWLRVPRLSVSHLLTVFPWAKSRKQGLRTISRYGDVIE